LTGRKKSMDKLMKPEDVAERCNYSVHSIRRLAAQDKIPHRRFGRTLRFDSSEVEGWLLQIARGPKVIANWTKRTEVAQCEG
jgi:excisionase family DNA binding protein